MRLSSAQLICPALVALFSMPLQAEVVAFPASADNTIYEEATGNSNGAGRYLFMGQTGEDNGIPASLRRALVAFDLAAIPTNALVDSVRVEFIINNEPSFTATPDFAVLHRAMRAWGEGTSNAPGAEGQGAPATAGDATWVSAFHPSPSWDQPGGDFHAMASGTAPFGAGSIPATLTFESSPGLVADVQRWVRAPETNFGWVLLGDEITVQNARRLASRECALAGCPDAAPTLTVDYRVPTPVDALQLTLLSDQLSRPVGIVNAGDGSGRVFVVEQAGVIRIFDTASGSLRATPFLDIRDQVFSVADAGGGSEQGLLGLAFHPGYAQNGRFFVNYTINPAPNTWHTVVAEFQVSGDPDLAMTVGETLLEFVQEARNHNGGDLHFGADGYLYIASGDGGGAEDQYGNAQNVDTLRGALLRIDVDSAPPPGAELCGIVNNHGIPAGNAFPGGNDGCDEILHIGLRNPWRFSFDAANGDLYIADVGQYQWEEVNVVPGSASGLNFGWPCREGQHDFPTDETCPPPLTEPVFDYPHVDGNCSITGGYVYRGSRLPLQGRYVYGDWCSQRIWVATREGGSWSSQEWPAAAQILQSLSSFGQDEQCELYVADREGGAIYRIDDGDMLLGSGFETRVCR